MDIHSLCSSPERMNVIKSRQFVVLGDVMVSVLAIGPTIRGFRPDR
jgi:hypothetical protein